MRLRQEIALGIGGWRLLDTLGIEPGACHLNEGHTAFVVLERARAAMRAHDLPFGAALAATRAGNLFTTHTSVAAGFDAFPPPLMAKYFPPGRGLLAELGLSLHDLMALGRAPGADAGEPFRPAYLAIRGAARVNAVSALHAETSKALFAPLFPRWPQAEVPITHVTNGVHVPSWDSSFTDELWTAACGPDRWRGSVEGHADSIACVDDAKTVRGQARHRWSSRCASDSDGSSRAAAPAPRRLRRPGERSTRTCSPSASPGASPSTSGTTCCSGTSRACAGC